MSVAHISIPQNGQNVYFNNVQANLINSYILDVGQVNVPVLSDVLSISANGSQDIKFKASDNKTDLLSISQTPSTIKSSNSAINFLASDGTTPLVSISGNVLDKCNSIKSTGSEVKILNSSGSAGGVNVGSFKMSTGAASGYVLTSDGTGVGTWAASGGGGGGSITSINGSTNQINVLNGTGPTVTLSTPQDISTTSSVQFGQAFIHQTAKPGVKIDASLEPCLRLDNTGTNGARFDIFSGGGGGSNYNNSLTFYNSTFPWKPTKLFIDPTISQVNFFKDGNDLDSSVLVGITCDNGHKGGLLLPALNTSDISALNNVKSNLIYDSTKNQIALNNGSEWQNLASYKSGSVTLLAPNGWSANTAAVFLYNLFSNGEVHATINLDYKNVSAADPTVLSWPAGTIPVAIRPTVQTGFNLNWNHYNGDGCGISQVILNTDGSILINLDVMGIAFGWAGVATNSSYKNYSSVVVWKV